MYLHMFINLFKYIYLYIYLYPEVILRDFKRCIFLLGPAFDELCACRFQGKTRAKFNNKIYIYMYICIG